MHHMELRSRAHPVHGDPVVATGGAQPLIVNALLDRDFRCWSSALEEDSNAAATGDQSHERCRSDMPESRLCSFARREHNRSLCHRRPDL